MQIKMSPLVSIVTPMYNNAEFVSKCIDSVLAQTYPHWDYVIVNNCSTDGSGDIARRYAARDARIRVIDNAEFLPVVANHNRAFEHISPDSKYCKMVFSDDWLFPRCLEEMVALAEAQPSVGIVGAYGLQGTETAVKWAGLPYPSDCVDGRELCRRFFLDGIYVFGTSHSLLFRSDFVRGRRPFFNEGNLHSDRETCIDLLRSCDFGFVHQVLTFTRERGGSLTDVGRRLNTNVGGRLYEVVKYGPEFLTAEELASCRDRIVNEYYNFLAVSLIRGGRDARFWELHKNKLAEAGVRFSYARLAAAVMARWLRAATRPGETLQKLQSARERK